MPPKRIVLGFDASSPGSAAAVAVELARALSAELAGVFVEETDAHRLAALPFAVLVESTGRSTPLGPRDLAALLRVAADRAERVLLREAARAHVRASFRVARGRLVRELESEAAERDVIVLESARPAARRDAPRGPVVVAVDDPETAFSLLDVAAAVAGPGSSVVAIVPRAGLARDRSLVWSRERARALWLVALPGFDVRSVAQAVARLSGGMLLLPRSPAWLDPAGVALLRQELDCPLVMVR